VIVVDTTAWVDLFRDRRTAVADTLERLISDGAELATTETVLMEVLAGARSGEELVRLHSRLVALPVLRLEGLADFEEAARISRSCRDAGEALRGHLDCLIAVPTIRHRATLLHNDRDFEKIARHADLRIEPVGPAEQIREGRGPWRRARASAPKRAHARRSRRLLTTTVAR
jgi:hypothetical protein